MPPIRSAKRAKAFPALSGQDNRAAIDATRRGLPIAAIDDAINSRRLSLSEADRLVLPRKTLSHRRKIGALTPEQSDRLLRVLRLVRAAEATFGSRQKAALWLRRPSNALAGDAPLALLDTSAGCREVEALLARIDHGLAA